MSHDEMVKLGKAWLLSFDNSSNNDNEQVSCCMNRR